MQKALLLLADQKDLVVAADLCCKLGGESGKRQKGAPQGRMRSAVEGDVGWDADQSMTLMTSAMGLNKFGCVRACVMVCVSDGVCSGVCVCV